MIMSGYTNNQLDNERERFESQEGEYTPDIDKILQECYENSISYQDFLEKCFKDPYLDDIDIIEGLAEYYASDIAATIYLRQYRKQERVRK